MKNIKKVAVLIVIAVGFLSFRGIHHHVKAQQAELISLFADTTTAFENTMNTCLDYALLDANDIEVIEEEETVELGFDTFEYLPIGFNAYAGMNLTEQDFEIFEEEETVDLGFDTSAYLPANFNAYSL